MPRTIIFNGAYTVKKLLLTPCFNFKKMFLFKTFICYITEIQLEFISEKSLEIVFENNNVMDEINIFINVKAAKVVNTVDLKLYKITASQKQIVVLL